MQNSGNGSGGNAQARPPIVLDDRFRGVDAQEMQRVGGRFQDIDFAGVEFVASRFVPVRAFLVRMIGQTDAFDLGGPVGAGLETVALHQA